MAGSGINSKASFHDRSFLWLVWSSLIIFTLLLVLFVRANSYFIADDYDHFIQAAHLPLVQLLSTPIDVHYVPLHKLFSALILQLAPLNFDLALGVMLAFHAASIVLLHRLLQALSESPANLLIVLLYACNPFLLHTLLWWSSGIHRFPYVLLCLASLYAYLRYRQARQPRYLAGCYLAFVLAFGFYSKAILIPFYILGLELCLGGLKSGRLSQRFAPGAVMLLVSLGYVLWYLMAVPVMQQGPTPNLLLVGEIVLSNFKVMAGVLTLQLYNAPNLAIKVAMALAMLTAILYSVWKARRSLWVWLVLFACVGISFAMVASSARGQVYGQMLATVHRYYWDVMFLFALFGGLVLAMLRRQPQPQPQPVHWIALLFCVGYIGVLGWMGRVHFFELYESSHVATARYMKQVITDLDRLPAQRPLLLAQGRFPSYVYGLGFTDIRMPFESVLPLRYGHLVMMPQGQADYVVDEITGEVLTSLEVEELRPQVTELANPPRLAPGMSLSFKDDAALPGWYAAEAEHRWSAGQEARVVFDVQPDATYLGRFTLDFGSLGNQRVSLLLNERSLGDFHFDASQSRFDLHFDPSQLNREGLNTLTFHLPDAQAPGNGDPRVLAIALRQLVLY